MKRDLRQLHWSRATRVMVLYLTNLNQIKKQHNIRASPPTNVSVLLNIYKTSGLKIARQFLHRIGPIDALKKATRTNSP